MFGRDPDWYADARCANADREAFYPPKGGSSTEAKRICNGDPKASAEQFRRPCPVRDQCRQYAIDNMVEHGIWGGLTDRERSVIRGRSREFVPADETRRLVEELVEAGVTEQRIATELGRKASRLKLDTRVTTATAARIAAIHAEHVGQSEEDAA